jgi:hypothetical protein
MKLRICMYCGEPMAEKGDAHSRDPNTCASCSSLSDGLPESGMSSFADFDDQLVREVAVHEVMDVAA